MAFPVSPGVNTTETALNTVPPIPDTTEGAIAGVFNWGPVNTVTLITGGEAQLLSAFGKPGNNNFETWFTAANFLQYSDSLYVVRTGNTAGTSNTLTGSFTNSTTFVIQSSAVSGVSNSGIVAAQSILGDGIPSNTVVSVVAATGTNTTITLSKASGNTANNYLAFVSTNAVFTAVANTGPITDSLALYNIGNTSNYDLKQPSFGSYAAYVAKWPGAKGNSLQISVCGSANQFSSNLNLVGFFSNVAGNTAATKIAFITGNNQAVVTIANTAGANDLQTTGLAGLIANSFIVGDFVLAGNASTIGTQTLQVNSVSNVITGNTSGTNTGTATFTLTFTSTFNLSANINQTSVTRYWQYYNNVDKAPGQSTFVTSFGNNSANDELHVVVVDQDGVFSGTPGTLLEVFSHLSRATDAMTQSGQTNYYKTVINQNSSYIWWANDRSGAVSNTALNIASSTNSVPQTLSFIGGSDGDTESALNFSVLAQGYDLFNSSENVDVSLVMCGKSFGGTSGEQVANYIYDNVISKRNDCVGFASPPANTVVIGSGSSVGSEAPNIVTWGNAVRGTDYLVLDSGYKYQYDKYNDVFRWVPLNGDVAGTCAFTDAVRDPWFSPGGENRGKIKNVVKLAWNPKQGDRNLLYQNSINPVVTFPGQGPMLYGDKTHLGQQTSFSRINVRRLFIVLRKVIAAAARSLLFEFNDEFSRAQFIAMVNPFLRDIKARRGIIDFRVVCDETNNTAQVINSNQFVGDIYIQPNQSINFILLNFVNVPAGVDFSEVAGNFGL